MAEVGYRALEALVGCRVLVEVAAQVLEKAEQAAKMTHGFEEVTGEEQASRAFRALPLVSSAVWGEEGDPDWRGSSLLVLDLVLSLPLACLRPRLVVAP